MPFSCLSVSLLQPCDPRLWNGSTLLLPLAHATASPWKQLVRPCLAAGTEDLSSAAPGLHGFGLNKPGRMLGSPSSLVTGGALAKSPTPSYSGSGREGFYPGSRFSMNSSSPSSRPPVIITPHPPKLRATLGSSGAPCGDHQCYMVKLLPISQPLRSLHPCCLC